MIDVKEGGIEVKIADTDLTAFIRRSDLSRDRDEQRPERFAKGEKVDARVTNFDKKTRKITVSIKALEIAEEKEAVAQYGSTDSGASLGDILGAALKDRDDDGEEDQDETPEFATIGSRMIKGPLAPPAGLFHAPAAALAAALDKALTPSARRTNVDCRGQSICP